MVGIWCVFGCFFGAFFWVFFGYFFSVFGICTIIILFVISILFCYFNHTSLFHQIFFSCFFLYSDLFYFINIITLFFQVFFWVLFLSIFCTFFSSDPTSAIGRGWKSTFNTDTKEVCTYIYVWLNAWLYVCLYVFVYRDVFLHY